MKQRIRRYANIVIIVGLMAYQIYNVISNRYGYSSVYIYISSAVYLLSCSWLLYDFCKRSKEEYEYQKFQREIAEDARKEKLGKVTKEN